MADPATDRVILMFSGGRDSTLAALRLHRAGHCLILITITADHLFGLNSVERRLREIAPLINPDTEWLQIPQPALRGTQHLFHQQTCLPCQSAYVVTGVNMARQFGIRKLALGYAGYQAGWPEQGPQARKILEKTLAQHDIELILPVYDIESRANAMDELKANGISEMALEQKCTRQVTNVVLEGATLLHQLDLWGQAINEELNKSRLLLGISSRMRLGDIA